MHGKWARREPGETGNGDSEKPSEMSACSRSKSFERDASRGRERRDYAGGDCFGAKATTSAGETAATKTSVSSSSPGKTASASPAPLTSGARGGDAGTEPQASWWSAPAESESTTGPVP